MLNSLKNLLLNCILSLCSYYKGSFHFRKSVLTWGQEKKLNLTLALQDSTDNAGSGSICLPCSADAADQEVGR